MIEWNRIWISWFEVVLWIVVFLFLIKDRVECKDGSGFSLKEQLDRIVGKNHKSHPFQPRLQKNEPLLLYRFLHLLDNLPGI